MAGNLDSKYTLEIQDHSGTLIVELTGRVDGRQIKFVRNGVYSATWTIDIDNFEVICRKMKVNPRGVLGVGSNQVVIKRLGVKVFSGKIINYQGSIDAQKVLTIQCVGWLEMFGYRYTGSARIFSATDAGSIAKTLIDETQALSQGSYGIITNISDIQTSVNRDITYSYKKIKDAIIELSSMQSGFDFDFTPDKRFIVYYPSMGTTHTDFVFEYPGNVKKAQISDDAQSLVNEAIVIGNGINATRDDTDSQSVYNLRQEIINLSSETIAQNLNDAGDATLASKKLPLEIVTLTLDGNIPPAFGSYWLGDRVTTRIHGLALYDNIVGTYRIDEIQITIDNTDSEEIQLKLTL